MADQHGGRPPKRAGTRPPAPEGRPDPAYLPPTFLVAYFVASVWRCCSYLFSHSYDPASIYAVGTCWEYYPAAQVLCPRFDRTSRKRPND